MSAIKRAAPARWAGMQRELVERAIGGDRDAFSSLVGASVGRLYAVATLILRDSDRAQDAVQDALISAWTDVRALREADAWGAWLHRLTVWACYPEASLRRARVALDEDWGRFHVVPLDAECMDRAIELGCEHQLRTLDAIHLAAARRLPGPMRLLTFDDRQATAAAAIGLEVVPAGDS